MCANLTIKIIVAAYKNTLQSINSLDNNNNNNNDDDDNKDKKTLTLIVDASGLTITKKGDYYIEQKWIRKKNKFIKLHIAVDAKSKKVVSFRVTKGNVHDSKKFSP
jgi:DDE family transposase